MQRQVERRDGEIGRALVDCANLYVGFIHRRFLKYASGGGDWRKLKKWYVQAKVAAGYDKRILIRTGLLEKQLRVGTASVIKQGASISIGIGRGKSYPSGVPVITVFIAHDRGQGVVPKRKIVVAPDAKTNKQITFRAEQGLKRAYE